MPTASATPAANAASARPPVQLFLASPPASVGQRRLDRLARFLDLDVFGNSLLSRRARADMRIQAVLLVIVFVFDLCVWTLMANLLFSTGGNGVGWYTLPALLFGLATAIVVFAWERSFATFDTRARGSRQLWRWAGFGLRGVLILCAALATAKPFELIAFHGPINERLYDESVRQQAVLHHLAITNLQGEVAALQKRRNNLASETQQVLDGADASIDKAVKALQLELGGVNKHIQRLSEDIATAEAEQRAAEATSWRGEREGLEGRRHALLQQIASFQLKPGEALIAERRRIAAQLDMEIAAKSDAIRTIQESLARIRSLRVSAQGATTAAGRAAPVEVGVFRQLRIVADLVAGVPPRWPDGNQTLITQVKGLYALEDTAVPETAAYNVIAWVAFAVGVVIPLMALLFKLLMSSEDSAQYYSLQAQLAAGNADAVQQAVTRRRTQALGSEVAA